MNVNTFRPGESFNFLKNDLKFIIVGVMIYLFIVGTNLVVTLTKSSFRPRTQYSITLLTTSTIYLLPAETILSG